MPICKTSADVAAAGGGIVSGKSASSCSSVAVVTPTGAAVRDDGRVPHE
jgi:hypothetical protein